MKRFCRLLLYAFALTPVMVVVLRAEALHGDFFVDQVSAVRLRFLRRRAAGRRRLN